MPTPRPAAVGRVAARRGLPRTHAHKRHLQRGGELPTEAFSGANALEMLTYLSLQALPRHSRTFSNVHLAGGWHDPVELKGVQTAVAEHAPHLLRGLSAEEIAQMAQRAASGGNHMSVQHAMDAAEVKIDLEEDEQDEEMQRHAALAKGLEDGVELPSLLQMLSGGSKRNNSSPDGGTPEHRLDEQVEGGAQDARGCGGEACACGEDARRTLQQRGECGQGGGGADGRSDARFAREAKVSDYGVAAAVLPAPLPLRPPLPCSADGARRGGSVQIVHL